MKSIENKEEYSMKNVRITVIRKVYHQDLMALYENPIEHACDMEEGYFFHKKLKNLWGYAIAHGKAWRALLLNWRTEREIFMMGG